MDEIWVPSGFNASSFRESGVRPPISVIPLGIDPNYFTPASGASDSVSVHLPVGVRVGRTQGSGDTAEVIRPGVRQSRRCKLVCKIINNDPQIDVPAEIRKLRLGAAADRISPA